MGAGREAAGVGKWGVSIRKEPATVTRRFSESLGFALMPLGFKIQRLLAREGAHTGAGDLMVLSRGLTSTVRSRGGWLATPITGNRPVPLISLVARTLH